MHLGRAERGDVPAEQLALDLLEVGIVFLGANDFLVLEKASGQVKRVIGGVVQATPVLDLAVNSASERGLLALALVFSMSTWFSATAVVPQLRQEWDLSRGEASWLTIAVQLGFVVGALLSSVGNVSDVLPPRLVDVV